MTKYVIIVPDGAADEPLELFGGKTAAGGGRDAQHGPDQH